MDERDFRRITEYFFFFFNFFNVDAARGFIWFSKHCSRSDRVRVLFPRHDERFPPTRTRGTTKIEIGWTVGERRDAHVRRRRSSTHYPYYHVCGRLSFCLSLFSFNLCLCHSFDRAQSYLTLSALIFLTLSFPDELFIANASR